ncbi:MAG: periplasmic heavy metal sensor [Calditrichaeota bacterium]|nr:periplasmic heavy metal sensor [Calditrichota bacterium]MCB9366305.1 periplasmic heavy metal sensor [Calditrichota bacterium]
MILGLALCLWAGVADAQNRRRTPEERRERLETVIIGKFAEELSLSPEQAELFFPRLRQFRSDTEGLQRELNESRRRLADISGDESAGKDEVKHLITQTNQLQSEILSQRESMLTDMADFLSPQQVSRCAVLLDELPRRLQQLMDERGQERGQDRGADPPRRRKY